MKLAYKLCTLVGVFLCAKHAHAATTIQGIIVGFGDTLRPLVAAGLGAAVMVFVWGGVVFITQAADEKARANGRMRMLWGIVGLFLIVAVWGIVALMRTTVGVSGITDCGAPQIMKDGYSTCF